MSDANDFLENVARASERMKREDLTALSYWFPKLEAAGLPVPKTIILDMPEAAQASIWRSFDGEEPLDDALAVFAAQVAEACAQVGYPAFLRTDHTSGKHEWNHTCFVPDAQSVIARIGRIAMFSECCDLFGMPWTRWVVREFLPTIPLGICPRYSDMPVCKEFRFFVDDGVIRCFHPYWPDHSLEQGGAEGIDLDALYCVDDEAALRALAEAAGRAVPGSWSIDLLETKRGWFITDMAEANRSFHWEGCDTQARSPAEGNPAIQPPTGGE